MVFRLFITFLIIILIGLVLFKNKEEIDGKVALAELKVERWPIRIQEVKHLDFDQKLEISSVLEGNELVKIFPKAQGEVVKVFKRQGETVNKGEVIAKLDDKLLKEELIISDGTLKQAILDHQRIVNLSKGDAVTKQQLEQAALRLKIEEAKYRSLKERIRQTLIKAGASGTITSLNVKESEVVSPAYPIGLISDIASLKTRIRLTAEKVLLIEIGMQVTVLVERYSSKPVEAKVTSIASIPGDDLKYEIEITINEQYSEQLVPGMFVVPQLTFPGEKSIWLPRNAVLGDLNQPYVYLVSKDQAEKRMVKLGALSSGQVQVKEGIDIQDSVIVEGQLNVSDGSKVKILNN